MQTNLNQGISLILDLNLPTTGTSRKMGIFHAEILPFNLQLLSYLIWLIGKTTKAIV